MKQELQVVTTSLEKVKKPGDTLPAKKTGKHQLGGAEQVEREAQQERIKRLKQCKEVVAERLRDHGDERRQSMEASAAAFGWSSAPVTLTGWLTSWHDPIERGSQMLDTDSKVDVEDILRFLPYIESDMCAKTKTWTTFIHLRLHIRRNRSPVSPSPLWGSANAGSCAGFGALPDSSSCEH